MSSTGAASSLIVSSDKYIVFSGGEEQWDTFSSIAQFFCGALVFVLHFAKNNTVDTRQMALEMYKDWCEEVHDKEFEKIKRDFHVEMKAKHGDNMLEWTSTKNSIFRAEMGTTSMIH